MNPAEEVSYL